MFYSVCKFIVKKTTLGTFKQLSKVKEQHLEEDQRKAERRLKSLSGTDSIGPLFQSNLKQKASCWVQGPSFG